MSRDLRGGGPWERWRRRRRRWWRRRRRKKGGEDENDSTIQVGEERMNGTEIVEIV